MFHWNLERGVKKMMNDQQLPGSTNADHRVYSVFFQIITLYSK